MCTLNPIVSSVFKKICGKVVFFPWNFRFFRYIYFYFKLCKIPSYKRDILHFMETNYIKFHLFMYDAKAGEGG